MLRISLIIAIVAGLAAAGLNFYKVREVMVTTLQDRDNEKSLKEQEMAAHRKTKKDLDKTSEELAGTKKKLETTEGELKQTASALAAKTEEATELAGLLDRTKGERDSAQAELNKWAIVNVTPEQVKGMIGELKNSKLEIGALTEENKVFSRKIKQLDTELAYLRGESQVVELPSSARGRVVAVDPKYDFVVVDVGEEKGALERGELLVNRNGKLIGKLRIATVQNGQSIANVLPEWKADEIVEGDVVLP
jgi:DNA repair exonuclease SbcCD ATPase subunit